MDNQHRLIKDYKELTPEQIELMNTIKNQGQALSVLIKMVERETLKSPGSEEQDRWINIGKDHLQQGLMALTRAVANPEFF